MEAEFQAVLRKEALVLGQGFGGRVAWARVLAASLLFAGGLLLPLMIGEYWIRNAAFLVVFPILGAVVVTQSIIDAVAGERERKTLETLLTTPAGAPALVFGKILPPVGLAAAISLGNLVTGVVTVNLMAWGDTILLPQGYLMLGLPLLSVLFPLTLVSAGFLGSLRARSTRQATQVFSLIVMVLLLVPSVTWVLLPAHLTLSWRAAWAGLDAPAIMAWVLALLAGLSALFLGLGVAGFRRERLTGF